jgi:hypothetical protein
LGAGNKDEVETNKTKTEEAEGEKKAKKPRKPAAKKDDKKTVGADANKPRKSRAEEPDAVTAEDLAVNEKALRKSRAKKAPAGDAGNDGLKEKVVVKSRAKKSDADTQSKLPKAQVTKVSTLRKGKESKEKDPTGGENPFKDVLDYGLAEAVKRRINWTPPPPISKTKSLITSVSTDDIDGGLNSEVSISSGKTKDFHTLLGSFGFNMVKSNTTKGVVLDAAGTRKRKLIELVKTNASASTTIPKAKAPKKKPRTITEQATSAYAEEEETAKPVPLLHYFSLETNQRAISDEFKVPPRPRSKSPIKRGKGKAQAPILLSPESALKQVGKQDFVFGTSSQLAREESPGFLRDIHAAMQVSNEMDDDPFASSPIRLGSKTKSPPTKRNLWSAAARDGTGQLLDVEMVDLVETPAVARKLHTAAMSKHESSPPSKEHDKLSLDIEGSIAAPTDTKTAENSTNVIGPLGEVIRIELLSSPASYAKGATSHAKFSTQYEVVPPELAPKTQAIKPAKSSKATNLEKPDFSAYTMAQLSKEIASYHFKPVKSRDQKIALLEKCWEGKRRLALGTLASNIPIPSLTKPGRSVTTDPPTCQVDNVSPMRARGRPRKGSSPTPSPKPKTKTASVANALSRARKAQKNAEAMDEISDSDVAPIPSPPRRHPSQVGTPPLPLPLSPSSSIDSGELSPASSQARLFRYITAAVKNAPTATDSKNPSWHEKMLLYDPIILEDLTVWLNTGALEQAGHDGEVEPKEVKKWCESMSICCLWKENLRGGTRSRY